MRLSQLLHRDLAVDPEITGVTADSRLVRPGFLFAARSEEHTSELQSP